MSTTVGIVVLNYNSVKDTIECAESILQLSNENYVLCIVDNASTDNSWEVLTDWINYKNPQVNPANSPIAHQQIDDLGDYASKKRNVFVVQTGTNGGYAAGNNFGIKYLRSKYDLEYFWILNNDLVVTSNALIELEAIASEQPDSSAFLIGQTLMYYSMPAKVQAVGGKLVRPWLSSQHVGENKLLSEIDNSMLAEIEYPVGAAMFFNVKFLDIAGFMNEGYFLYYEEIDWIVQAKAKGISLFHCNKATVFHKKGGSTKKVNGIGIAYSVRNRVRYSYRNSWADLPATLFYFFVFAIKKLVKQQWQTLRYLMLPKR